MLNEVTARLEKFETEAAARIIKLEADVGSQHKGLEKEHVTNDIMKAAIEQLAGKVGQALDYVSDEGKTLDARLGAELDAMTIKIEAKLQQMSSDGPPQPMP